MQNTICPHRNSGKAGGIFKSYEIIKVGQVHRLYFTISMLSWMDVHCICIHVCYTTYTQIERVLNPKMWEKYVYRRSEVCPHTLYECSTHLMTINYMYMYMYMYIAVYYDALYAHLCRSVSPTTVAAMRECCSTVSVSVCHWFNTCS